MYVTSGCGGAWLLSCYYDVAPVIGMWVWLLRSNVHFLVCGKMASVPGTYVSTDTSCIALRSKSNEHLLR